MCNIRVNGQIAITISLFYGAHKTKFDSAQCISFPQIVRKLICSACIFADEMLCKVSDPECGQYNLTGILFIHMHK